MKRECTSRQHKTLPMLLVMMSVGMLLSGLSGMEEADGGSGQKTVAY